MHTASITLQDGLVLSVDGETEFGPEMRKLGKQSLWSLRSPRNGIYSAILFLNGDLIVYQGMLQKEIAFLRA